MGELALWGEEALRIELEELEAVDYPLEVMGFTELDLKDLFTEIEDDTPKEEKTTLPMLRFGSNSIRITEDELIILSNRYNEYVEAEIDEGFVVWLLKRGL